MPCSYPLVGASNLQGSSLGKHSLGEGVEFPELDGGLLGFIFLLDGCLPQLASLVLHLLQDLNTTLLNRSHNSIEHLANLLLSCGPVLLDLVDGAIQVVVSSSLLVMVMV